ncbi:MAG TPA: MotA/TolQ/ExbB proton channel family protein [Oscillatoriales cyanobacterium M59_W2019_021]|nr:MAG: MotA/TolQ/ExbB proton channel family protein [Cyanobacteria bacterium J055]HIK29918.1 MotA/TolQ/ExbB proton channel family protein [Oscillatoriales cyanobacterium M4454_W2019_049]HIK51383.1 MotA/TolQ/ExbB proton channel family protein [Oscillatoriales cyanobacterium M59_W2019_021]
MYLFHFLLEVAPVVEEPPKRIIDTFLAGGPVMWPLLGLSIITFTTALERGWFWVRLISQEDRIVRDVLEAAKYDLDKAAEIAEYARYLTIGRFLLAPLKLRQPTPETFRLAMESAGDKEFVKMRKGSKVLETVIAVSPLLGLLGTVTGLINTFGNLNIGGGGSTASATQAAAGIGEALLTTAAGMIVAIIALLFFQLFVTLQSKQVEYFAEVGNELELIYRQIWYEPLQNDLDRALPIGDARTESSFL